MRLTYSAISDVGRIRKDNQDSGYVGPHLVVICDGVGGAARGDIASSTAVAELRKLEETPPGPGGSSASLRSWAIAVLDAMSPRAAPPTPSHTAIRCGPTYPESWLSLRTRPTSEIAL